MLYQRSHDIERRLEGLLRLIQSGGHSAPMLARRLGVSVPTVSRDVQALRERGYDIRSERREDCWQYVLAENGTTSRPRPALIAEAQA